MWKDIATFQLKQTLKIIQSFKGETAFANFFYTKGIPFNIVRSISYEIMVESIGQFGPGFKPQSNHELIVSLLEKAKKKRQTN